MLFNPICLWCDRQPSSSLFPVVGLMFRLTDLLSDKLKINTLQIIFGAQCHLWNYGIEYINKNIAMSIKITPWFLKWFKWNKYPSPPPKVEQVDERLIGLCISKFHWAFWLTDTLTVLLIPLKFAFWSNAYKELSMTHQSKYGRLNWN